MDQIRPLSEDQSPRILSLEESIARLQEHQFEQVWDRPKPIALIDVDGVMQDHHHRLHHIVCPKTFDYLSEPDWDTFHSLAHLDTDGAFREVTKALSYVYILVYLTARVQSSDETYWKLYNRLQRQPNDNTHHLIMRPNTSKFMMQNYMFAVAFKQSVVQQMKAAKLDIAMAVDDSHANCQMFAAEGITTLRLYNHLAPTQFHY